MSKRAELIQAIYDAAAECQVSRAHSLIEAPYRVAGITVRPINGRHYNILSRSGNAFVVGRAATMADACMFLWVVSEHYSSRISIDTFLQVIDLENVIDEVRKYIESNFMDLPFGGSADEEPIVAPMAWNVHILAAAYGWTDTEINERPLAKTYQLMRLIMRDRNPKAKFYNKKVRDAWSAFNHWSSEQYKLKMAQQSPPSKQKGKRHGRNRRH